MKMRNGDRKNLNSDRKSGYLKKNPLNVRSP